MTRIDLDGFYLLLTDMPNRTTCHVASQKGLRVVHVLRRWTGSIYWNGRELDRSGVIVWGDSCDYCRVGSDVQTIALVIDESMLRQQIETWTNSSHAFWDALDGHMLADTPASRRFIEGMEWVFALAEHAPERFGFPEIRASLREQLLLALIEAVDAPGDGVLLGNPIDRHRTRIVRQMTEYLVAHPDGLMELSDLCELTGFSARSISYACETALGISPMRYLKLIRLNRARTLLRQGARESTSVSECAHFVGFAHLGRFSAEYRKLFGESPRQTLERSG
jgi:AraC family ethanolamine operon transcriptional activator